ncbi:MAG: thioredoxin family protein [Gammaproteobacteria bacterium]|nr:thioredoxin family protein [Gammaproteobacteria bacterium]
MDSRKTINKFDDFCSPSGRRGGHFFLLLLLLFSALPNVTAEAAEAADAGWYQIDAQGEVSLRLTFFWSTLCPHCETARPLVEAYAAAHPWLRLESLELGASASNRERYRRMAASLGVEARAVPAFFYCGGMQVGFDAAHGGAELFDGIEACRERLRAGEGMQGPVPTTRLPMGVERGDLGLVTLTVMLATLDAFNPCAFFVLLFLLGMLSHAAERRRMLLVGGIFVFFSALLYFLFMSAWLNLFLLLGWMRPVTIVAALLALLAASLNIKDALYPGSGPSLSIPDERKPGLFRRMRGLLQLQGTAGLLLATVVLALLANSYELLCTSGLPMVYTRILTLELLPRTDYYLYLLLYNLVYVTPLALLVLLFSLGVARGKLQALGGRLLKLLSGLMMLGLGLLLLLAPHWLNSPWSTVLVIALALLITLLFRRHWRQNTKKIEKKSQ